MSGGAASKQTVHPSERHKLPHPPTGRVRLSVSSPSPFAGPWHPFTLGLTGSTPPSALPPPLPPSVRPGWAEGLKLQHSLHTPRAEKKQLLRYPGPARPRSPRTELSVRFPRSDHQKLLNLWILCEAVNSKSPNATLPAHRPFRRRLKTIKAC